MEQLESDLLAKIINEDKLTERTTKFIAYQVKFLNSSDTYFHHRKKKVEKKILKIKI